MKIITRAFLALSLMILLIACEANVDPASTQKNADDNELNIEPKVMQIVKLRTGLSLEELMAKAREREPQFEALPGLIQKYYIQIDDSTYGGVYIWDSQASLAEFRQSELATTIAASYQVIGKPDIEIADILFQLRE